MRATPGWVTSGMFPHWLAGVAFRAETAASVWPFQRAASSQKVPILATFEDNQLPHLQSPQPSARQ